MDASDKLTLSLFLLVLVAGCVGLGGMIESCMTGPQEVCEALGGTLMTRLPGGDYRGGVIVCDVRGQPLTVTVEAVTLTVQR